MTFCHISGHKVGLCHQLSVLIKEQMLCGQVDFHVRIPVIILTMAVRSLGVDRLTLHLFALFDLL